MEDNTIFLNKTSLSIIKSANCYGIQSELVQKTLEILLIAMQNNKYSINIKNINGFNLSNFRFPSVTKWKKALSSSALCDKEQGIIVVDGDFIYLKRFYKLELKIAKFINEHKNIDLRNKHIIKEILSKLLNNQSDLYQSTACIIAAITNFCIITGGPGSGKTTTVTNILKVLLTIETTAKILVCAPTGKAVTRLTESLADHIPVKNFTISTVHKILQINEITGFSKFNEFEQLDFDVILVDESSMLDISMFYLLVNAIKADAKLILLGDKHQLPAVGIGDIFNSLCEHPNIFCKQTSTFINDILVGLTDEKIPQSEYKSNALINNVLMLQKSFRFKDNEIIFALSKAIFLENADDFWCLLNNPDDNLQFFKNFNQSEVLQKIAKKYQILVDAAENNCNPSEAFAIIKKFIALSPSREGDFGVDTLNSKLNSRFNKDKSAWYAGKLIIIRKNDYNLKLFNGDVGVCLHTEFGLKVFFQQGDSYVSFHVNSITYFDVAFLLTVHQSQGSEYDEVLFVLPEMSKFVTKNVIYTAITRSKKRLVFFCNEKSLKKIFINVQDSQNSIFYQIDKLKNQQLELF